MLTGLAAGPQAKNERDLREAAFDGEIDDVRSDTGVVLEQVYWSSTRAVVLGVVLEAAFDGEIDDYRSRTGVAPEQVYQSSTRAVVLGLVRKAAVDGEIDDVRSGAASAILSTG